MDENKTQKNENIEPVTEKAVEEATAAETAKKEIDPEEIVKSIFNTPEKTKQEKDKTVKKPVNIFSRPINVLQNDDAKKSRIKTVIIEGLLFGAFITAITAIYSLSGLDLKLDPENSMQTPSVWFFLVEFVFFSIFIGVGDYFLTEKRVNDYNQQVAGLAFDMDSEIEKALEKQKEEGISDDEAAAANKSNGEETPKTFIDIRPVENYGESLTDKAFEAYISDKQVGKVECCKGVILDSNGFEQIILNVTVLEATDENYANGVAAELVNALRAEAATDGFAAVAVKESVYKELEFTLPLADKFNITTTEKTKIAESYPGSLLEISGELK